MAEPTATPGYAGCNWPLDPGCLEDEWAALTPDLQERSQALAGATLRRLTGYRVGGCPVTVRPCKTGCSNGLLSPLYSMQYGSFQPHINPAGYWVNSCGCLTDCACSTVCEINLPVPASEVYAVKVNGSVIPSTDYRLDSEGRLVWTGAGACPWPACQDLSKPDTAAGTFSVRYLNSHPVDKMGEVAAGVLAMEFARACTGGVCRLPSNITNISRLGVTMEIEPGSFPNGLTGIREVDSYVMLWNPEGLRQRAGVWSPSTRNPRVTR
jgi:hypothetical protein